MHNGTGDAALSGEDLSLGGGVFGKAGHVGHEGLGEGELLLLDPLLGGKLEACARDGEVGSAEEAIGIVRTKGSGDPGRELYGDGGGQGHEGGQNDELHRLQQRRDSRYEVQNCYMKL